MLGDSHHQLWLLYNSHFPKVGHLLLHPHQTSASAEHSSQVGKVKGLRSSSLMGSDEVSQTWEGSKGEQQRKADLRVWVLVPCVSGEQCSASSRSKNSTHIMLPNFHPRVSHGTMALGSHHLPLTQFCYLLAVSSARVDFQEQLFKTQGSIGSSGG